ncbi:MAG: tetratricopeptide repeat protein [Dysgonamonadaceae bacterium]|nr:tetratricopeptide repeat protein [Dysgonamonadaceae bacterium]MDD4245829.1 tetratricopeptide repeat protein [Dysgonamonadaceae bacterium]
MKLYKLIFLMILFFPAWAFGQVSEEAMKLFEEGNYEQAKSVLKIDFENDPADATINKLLGIAALKTGDIETAEHSLTVASKKRIHEATLYLGRLYAMQYKFDDAEKQFAAFEKAMRRNKEALAELEKEREYADRLRRMNGRTEDIQIIDSIVVSKRDLLSAYNLSESGGSLEWARDFFDDGWNEDNSVVFMNERKTKVYFSRFATERGSTLYTMEKMLENFGNEKMLPAPISDAKDQAYPFIMSDGLTIYFATKGHETIGGYDLYASRLNLNSNTYLTPNQMNMPFNSPFNDYMMVIDEKKGIGWFASDRYQPEGQVCVYTFIPNQEVLLIQSDDEKILANRAKISSIQDSWRTDKDYSSLRDIASKRSNKITDTAADFDFVINNDYTYHQLADFKSFSAREYFIRARDAKREFEELSKQLDEKREQYAASASNVSTPLGVEILYMEKRVSELFDQWKATETVARNEEIQYINSQP